MSALSADLFLHSDVPTLDVFARLCDVDPDGTSTNVADGIVRIHAEKVDRTADGVLAVRVELSATADRFDPGYRLRLHVSGGAHPLFARNAGTDEPLASATSLAIARNAVCHEPKRRSVLLLPRVRG